MVESKLASQTLVSWGEEDWRTAFAASVRSAEELVELLDLGEAAESFTAGGARAAAKQFPVRVPHAFAARMKAGDPEDPLLRQVAPAAEETDEIEGYVDDPLAEEASSPVPGLLHKYHGRVLLVVTGACPVHCRYCFRRHFPYEDQRAQGQRLDRALSYIEGDSSIREVILSGGDPLSLPDAALRELEARLAAIPHLERLRLHTRWPVVAPERVGVGLLRLLQDSRLESVVVVHSNHPREIDEDVTRALRAIGDCRIPVLNQSVLLRGVNDSADTLCELSDVLFGAGVSPYYLHLLDRVAGAAHFHVGEVEAVALHRELARRLPGYLVPRLVREEVGAPAKVTIAPSSF